MSETDRHSTEPTIVERRLTHGSASQNPTRIVVHCMAEFLDYEGERLHAADFLERIGLSAHALVDSAGNIFRCRLVSQGAYHAKGHNKNSLGIEFLVPGVHTLAELQQRTRTPWVSEAQLAAGVYWVRRWVRMHLIKPDRIVRHSDLDPERKWFDPGQGFQWADFLSRVTAATHPHRIN